MNLDLSGKRALVCGSSQGIGRAIAVELASLGARVTLMARDADRLSVVAGMLPQVPSGPHSVLVADFSDAAAAALTAAGAMGNGDLFHILINNTGGPAPGPAIEATPEQYLAAFTAHLLCNQALANTLVPGMRAVKYGRIVNIISTSVKQPIPNLGVSNTIRGAVASWAKTLSMELAPFGITVNNVLPGYTKTDRLAALVKGRAAKAGSSEDAVAKELIATIPAGRFADPEETAAAAAFLCTPAAAYINGINLPVDGGRLGSL